MTIWKPEQSPDNFPAAWHSALLAPPGRHLLVVTELSSRAVKIRYRFGAFRASLRAHPNHATAQRLAKLVTIIRTERAEEKISIWLDTRWHNSVLLARSQVLVKKD